jgi:hypothetical protein
VTSKYPPRLTVSKTFLCKHEGIINCHRLSCMPRHICPFDSATLGLILPSLVFVNDRVSLCPIVPDSSKGKTILQQVWLASKRVSS